MSYAASDPAQLLMLAFQDADSAEWAVQDLRELRLHQRIHAESMALLKREASGEASCTVEIADMGCSEAELVAALGGVLVGTLTDNPVDTTAGSPCGSVGDRIAPKRIDRGLFPARLKRLQSYLVADNLAIILLMRKSEVARLASALATSRAIARAKQLWVDLDCDLDTLIADVVGPHVAISAALLAAAESPLSAEMSL
jgi:uncharacterized membrane protein